jgi:sugar-specific transcriptional regulator TrmB
MLQTFLKSFQLTEKETKVFLKSLEMGAQPASHIARVCEMPRNTIRSMLDVLVRKGLMVKSKRANTQYYATEKKENIMRMLKIKKLRTDEEIDTQMRLLEEYGEELSARHWAASRPRITFYEGSAGLEKVLEDTLSSKENLRSWASYDALMDVSPAYFNDYFKRRTKKGISMKSIHPDTAAAREGQARDARESRQSALIPADRFNWSPEIQVYDNKINITSWQEKLGIIIESQEIADAMKVIFDLSYEAAERYGKTTPPVKRS